MDRDFDALVVGAAAAGLLGQDGASPAQLYAAGRAQLAALPTVELRAGRVIGVEAVTGDAADSADSAFRATLAGGDAVTARRVLLAGGMRYAVPDTPGLAALWGDRAFACPYCHGWEHRDQRIGILGATAAGHRAALLRSWSDDLVVLADRELPPEDRDALRAAGVPVTERPVASVAPGLVRFADGGELAVDALHVMAPMTPRDDLAATLGVATTELPNGTGIAVADTFGTTSVPGVFAAGDAAGAGNVAAAIAGGSLAATGLHRTLVGQLR